MNLQARLTLWAIALVAVIVGIASALDLSSEINREFDSTAHDTELIRRFTRGVDSAGRHRQQFRPAFERIAERTGSPDGKRETTGGGRGVRPRRPNYRGQLSAKDRTAVSPVAELERRGEAAQLVRQDAAALAGPAATMRSPGRRSTASPSSWCCVRRSSGGNCCPC